MTLSRVAAGVRRVRRACWCLVVGCALVLGACGGVVELYANMPERDANEVLAALQRVGIDARKIPGKDGMVHLTVPQSEVAPAIAHLEEVGLPRGTRISMGEVFRKEGLISSPLEERARYLWALSQELSETLLQIDGVLKARVHVVLPERSTGMDPALPSSAAVFIKHRPEVDMQQVHAQIRQLVASSIAGLSPDRVSVITVAAVSLPQPGGPAATASARGAPVAGSAPNTSSNPVWPRWLAGAVGAAGLAGLGLALWRRRQARPGPGEVTEDGSRQSPA